MPTILLIKGWRFFFYADEGQEPIHVHAEEKNMNKQHDVQGIEFSEKIMILHVDGHTLSVGLDEVSAVLAKAGQRERETFTVSPAGYGIHWPMLDEDLSIDGLLRQANPKLAKTVARQTA